MNCCPKCGTSEHFIYWKITSGEENAYRRVNRDSNLYKPCFVTRTYCECSLCGYKTKINGQVVRY